MDNNLKNEAIQIRSQSDTYPSLLVSTIPARSLTESELKFASEYIPRYFCTKSAGVIYFSPFFSLDAYYKKANT
jgi:hypothetical protein